MRMCVGIIFWSAVALLVERSDANHDSTRRVPIASPSERLGHARAMQGRAGGFHHRSDVVVSALG
jgi:hypothetical protein